MCILSPLNSALRTNPPQNKNQPLNCPKSALIHPSKKNPNTFQFISKIYPIYALKPPTPKPQIIDLILALKHLEILP